MVDKLNGLRQSIDSKKLESNALRAEFEKKLADLVSEKNALVKELDLVEKLASEAASSGFIKVKVKHFTFPFHYMGGGDSSCRTYKKETVRYCEPEEAFFLLNKKEEISYGSGLEYSKL